jgi:hypothetical protein
MTAARGPQSSDNQALILRALNVIYSEWEILSRDSGAVGLEISMRDFAPSNPRKLDSILYRLHIEGLILQYGYDEGVYEIICNENFKKRYDTYIKRLTNVRNEPTLSSASVPDSFEVKLRDRAILINDYLLSTPYGEGKNMACLEYCFEHPNTDLKRTSMPESAQKELRSKEFTKILNELGFVKEIRKAFFPTRSKSGLYFRNPVSASKLEEEGINTEILVRLLEIENIRHKPK